MRPLVAARPAPAEEPIAVNQVGPRGRIPLLEREAPLGYLLVLPAVLYLGIFIAYPFVMSVGLSFLDAQAGSARWAFIGWNNYSKVDAYQIVANNFRIASFDSEQDARAFASQRKQGTVTTEPSGQRFKAVLHVGGKDVPLIEMDSDSDASFNAGSVLQDLDWTVRRHGKKWDVIANTGENPITLGEFSDRSKMKEELKHDLLVEADTKVISKGTGVLQDSNFPLALKNTFKYTFFTEFFKMLIGVPCALLLNRKFAGRRLLRGLLVIPWVIPIAISAQAWLWILDSTYSVINWTLTHLHILSPGHVINFRGDADYAMGSVIAVNIWRGFPFTAIIILAGLTAIPDEILERARLDGANAFQRFFHIIAPMVRPILMVSLLFSVIFSFTDFNTIWIITKGGPYDQTQVLSTYAYQLGINAGYLGKGAAISLFMFPIMAVMVFAMLQFLRRENM
ncbi:MAG: carbohydrate ABC transporter permease [Myxococcales bacterium]